jgi:hypothetical protein
MKVAAFFPSEIDMKKRFRPIDRTDCDAYKNDPALYKTFQRDIQESLMAWSVDSESATVFYRTRKYWYAFTICSDWQSIICLRFPRRVRNVHKSYEKARIISWTPIEECGVGRKWLRDYSHRRIPLFAEQEPLDEGLSK